MFTKSVGNLLSKTCVILFVFTLIISSNTYSQSWQWARRAGGVDMDNATKVATDLFGNIYTTGYFSSDTVTLGGITLSNVHSGSADIFLAKYDSLGNVLWAKSGGGIGWELSEAVATDIYGNVFVTGYFNSSTIVFDTFLLHGGSYYNVFLVKYDPLGNVVWAKSSIGTYNDYSNSVKTDGAGNVYISGKYGSSIIQFDGDSLFNRGGEDMFIVKYDNFGNLIWAKSAGGDGIDEALNINIDAANNLFVCGYFDGTNFAAETDTLINDSVGTQDIFIAKYDSSGSVVWLMGAGGVGNAKATALATDDSGNVYIAGNFTSDISFDTTTLYGVGTSTDIFLTKYDTAGNFKWAKRAGGGGNDNVTSVTVDIFNNVYIAGYFASPSIVFGSYTLTNSGGNDVFFARYNFQGNVYGAARAGGSTDDFGQSLTTDHVGNVYMAGSFESPTITFGSTTLTNSSISTGTMDIFVAKYFDPFVRTNPISNTQDKINLFPNPSFGRLTLELEYNENSLITIFDNLGRVVYRNNENCNEKSLQIDIHNYPDGVYYLSLNSPNSNKSTSFVVKR